MVDISTWKNIRVRPKEHRFRGRQHIDGNGYLMTRNKGEEGVCARLWKGKFLEGERVNESNSFEWSHLIMQPFLNWVSLGNFVFFLLVSEVGRFNPLLGPGIPLVILTIVKPSQYSATGLLTILYIYQSP